MASNAVFLDWAQKQPNTKMPHDQYKDSKSFSLWQGFHVVTAESMHYIKMELK